MAKQKMKNGKAKLENFAQLIRIINNVKCKMWNAYLIIKRQRSTTRTVISRFEFSMDNWKPLPPFMADTKPSLTHKTIIQLNLIEKGVEKYYGIRKLNEFFLWIFSVCFHELNSFDHLWLGVKIVHHSQCKARIKTAVFLRFVFKMFLFCICNWLETKSIMVFA